MVGTSRVLWFPFPHLPRKHSSSHGSYPFDFPPPRHTRIRGSMQPSPSPPSSVAYRAPSLVVRRRAPRRRRVDLGHGQEMKPLFRIVRGNPTVPPFFLGRDERTDRLRLSQSSLARRQSRVFLGRIEESVPSHRPRNPGEWRRT